MTDSPQKTVFDALFTHFAIPEEIGCWAEESIIVQRLDNRDAGFGASRVDRGRDHHERIVNVNQLRLFFPQYGKYIAASIAGPNHLFK